MGANIAAGRGYVLSEPLARQYATNFAVQGAPLPAPSRPIGYYLPVYAVLLAPLDKFFGSSCVTARIVNAVLDGTLGPLVAFALLSLFGMPVGGLVSACLYAIAGPLIEATTLAAPDSLSSLFTLGSALPLAWGLRRGRSVLGALLALVPGYAVVGFAAAHGWRLRLSAARLVVAGWLVAISPLAVFWTLEYGAPTLSRPGIGIRLWEGVAMRSDEDAIHSLGKLGLSYGTTEGDNALVRDAIASIAAHPPSYESLVLNRAQRVLLTFGASALLALPCIVLAVRRNPLLGALLGIVWLSRVGPFSLFVFQDRDLLPLAAVAALGMGYLAARLTLAVARIHPTLKATS